MWESRALFIQTLAGTTMMNLYTVCVGGQCNMAAKGETTTSKPHNSTWTNRTSEWKSKWFVLESQRSEILCYKVSAS